MKKSEQQKDLGVLTSGTLLWNDQINSCVSKANQMICWITRNLISREQSLMLRIYKTLIRPHLEYCVQLWNPAPEHGNWSQILKIEGVQRRFTRMIDAKEKMDKAIEKGKEKYYKSLLDNTDNSMRKKWDAIRTIINRKKINQNDSPIPSHILGQHYSQVADKLANELPNVLPDDIVTSSSSFDNINIKSTLNGFSFVSTTNREIYELILQLDCSKGPGTDEIDIKSLRSVANLIAPHLALLFNQSILEGIYPQCFKTARCVPIFKGFPLDPSLPVNYRPISILTAINKVFERILHRQLVNYLEQNRLLPCFQYGYRKNHKTSQALLDLNNYLSKALADKI